MEVKTYNGTAIFNVKQIKRSSKEKVDVTIIIRVKNEEKKIDECIQSILNQEYDGTYDILLIDSGSTDDTLNIAKKYDMNIYTIPSEQFNFGSSIQLGINLSNSEFCVLISGHAIPTNELWLSNILDGFEDKNVAAVYGSQRYKEDAYFIEKRALDTTFGAVRKIQKWNKNFNKYVDYKNDILFSNANSCIKKSIAMSIPFSTLIASEDREWAMRVLKENYKIIYNPDAAVYHYHNETLDKYYKRMFINAKALYEFTGFKINKFLIIPTFMLNILKNFKYMIRNGLINISNVNMSIKYGWKYALAKYDGTHEKR